MTHLETLHISNTQELLQSDDGLADAIAGLGCPRHLELGEAVESTFEMMRGMRAGLVT